MPSNIIDKLAWWIPIKKYREKFRYYYSNNKKEDNTIEKLMSMSKKEIIETYPDLYNHIINTKTAHSDLVCKYLLGLKGIEIGGSSFADFGIDVIHINMEDEKNLDKENIDGQIKAHGFVQKTDIVANGDDLPFKDNTIDFIFSSHVLEHFFDPIKALKEWYRVIKKDGYIVMTIPHKERTSDKDRERTTLKELIDRNNGSIVREIFSPLYHYSVWITEDLLELCKYLNFNVIEYQDIDDIVGRGNGFTIVIKK